ncbi:MAG: helix-turn-helix domain-containing protein [Candidatus Binataceae bacterium]
MDELVKETEAAEYLKLSTACLQAWRSKRIGPPFVALSRKAVRYRLADLEEYVRQREVVTEK